MEKLKQRWGITSNWQIIVIMIVFSVTGSTAVMIAKPVIEYLGINKELGSFVYWTLRILIIFPLYQILLVLFGWLFGQFTFFWNMEKKMIKRLGLGYLLK